MPHESLASGREARGRHDRTPRAPGSRVAPARMPLADEPRTLSRLRGPLLGEGAKQVDVVEIVGQEVLQDDHLGAGVGVGVGSGALRSAPVPERSAAPTKFGTK